jgi:hypothetical protein
MWTALDTRIDRFRIPPEWTTSCTAAASTARFGRRVSGRRIWIARSPGARLERTGRLRQQTVEVTLPA